MRPLAAFAGCAAPSRLQEETTTMTPATLEAHDRETIAVTGTADKDYSLVSFLQRCLSNVLHREIYAQDAERRGDQELAELLHRAQSESREGAEEGKQLLRDRLQA
jgi:hypothetical protein